MKTINLSTDVQINTKENSMIAKLLLSAVLTLASATTFAAVESIPSVLSHKAQLTGIGQVAYRPPVKDAYKETIVLMQGVFGGTTHRHMTEVRGILDTMGYKVYTLDLPGTGESDSPKIISSLEILNKFVEAFLVEVVKEPAIFVGEQLLGTAALHVSKLRPDLFQRIVLISPAGVRFLAGPPNPFQDQLFNKYWGDDVGAVAWYRELVGEKSARYYLGKAYYNQDEVTDERIHEITMCSQFPGQTWATLSFVGGRIYGSFADASKDVTVPVTAIFGKFPGSPVTGAPPETWDMFQAIQPNFKYVVIDNAGNLPHREQRIETVYQILQNP
jgi:pimeloyl-ACP methyl ester carboxylesterase